MQTLRTYILIIALAMVGLGCSRISLTYNFADWLLYWRIDQYFDVSSQQKPLLNTHLGQFHTWHRQKEIPEYIHFLNTILHDWQDGLTRQELDRIFHTYQTLRNRLGTRFAQESIAFIDTLIPSQIEHFEHTMKEYNQELRDEIESDPAVRKEKRLDAVINWLEGWVGELSLNQIQKMTPFIHQFPDTTQAWLTYRAHRQHQFLTLLKARADSTSIEQQVRHWLTMSPQGAPPHYPSFAEKRDQKLKEVILAIDPILTAKQRNHASGQIHALIQDFQDLVWKDK